MRRGNKASLRLRARLLVAIRQYWATHGHGPAHADLRAAVGITNPNTLVWHLKHLRKDGLITWTPRVVRSIRLVSTQAQGGK